MSEAMVVEVDSQETLALDFWDIANSNVEGSEPEEKRRRLGQSIFLVQRGAINCPLFSEFFQCNSRA